MWATRAKRKERAVIFGEPSYLIAMFTWLVRPFLKFDVRKNLTTYQELEAQALLPFYKTREFRKVLMQKTAKLPWYYFVSKQVMGNMNLPFLKEAMLEATFLVSRTGLTCKLHKNRTGGYPENLEALVPGILSEIPIDPFTGKPLVYRREGEGFLVYSLGFNEKDDGGLSVYQRGSVYAKSPYDRDDWAWKETK